MFQAVERVRGWFFRYNTTDGIQFAFRNSTTDVSLSNGYHPIIGQWVHICVSVSPTSKTLYINGVSNATLGADNIVYLGNQETYFGRLGILSLQLFWRLNRPSKNIRFSFKRLSSNTALQ